MENENNSAAVSEEVTTDVTGANAQEVAAPAETETASGANAQEVAEPAGTEASNEMSPEERHQQAAARRDAQSAQRQRQMDEEINRRTQEKLDEFVARMGKVNPKTGKVITTQAEYDEVEAAQRRRKRETELKKAGIDPATIEEMINDHPDVKGARQAQAAAEASKAHYEKLAREEAAREELRKIRKIDPNIRSVDDLMGHPKYAEIKELVQKNNHSISEAFDIATKGDRDAQAQARARDSAAATAGSKAHMVSSAGTGTAGGEITAVPAEVAALYRKDNPRLTDEQIRAKYARYEKLKKG